MSAGGEIVAVLARQGYKLRNDDTSAAPHGFVHLTYGKGRWVDNPNIEGWQWMWDGRDRKLVELMLPEELFDPGHPEADQ